MNSYNNKTHKPVKDRDLKTITYFIRVAGLTIPFLCLLGLYVGYVHWGLSGAVSGVVLAVIVGLLISVIVMFLMDGVSGAASSLISGRREAVWTIREQVQGYLSQARFNKENKDYPAAFSFVNKVLEKDPDFADALLLKAQILWEGFGRSDAATQFLEKTLSLKDGSKMVQNQAIMLHSDLSVLERPSDVTVVPEGIEIGLRSRKASTAKRLTGESFQDLKDRAGETPMAWWAVYTAVVFGLFLVCVLASMNRQIQKLDSVSTMVTHSIENTMKTTQSHADGIQEVEKTIQAMTSELSRITNRLNNKK